MSSMETGQTVFDSTIQCVVAGEDPLEFLAELVDLARLDRDAVEHASRRLRSLVTLQPNDRLASRALGLVEEALRLASRREAK